MADPVTAILGALGIGANALGAFQQAAGAQYTAAAQAAQATYQAGVAKVNAALAAQDQAYTEAAGGVATQQVGMAGRAQLGQTRAVFGAGGIAPGTGSAAAVQSSEVALGQQQQAITSANYAKQAYGYQVAGAQDVAQAGAYTSAASTAITAGGIQATSSILGGVGSVSTKWMQATQTGVFPSPTSLPSVASGGTASPGIIQTG